MQSTRVTCVSHRGHLCRENCSRPIARTRCLSSRPGYLMALSSSGWITYGSANFCSWQDRNWHAVPRVPMFRCWKSTRAHGNQVMYVYYAYFAYFDLFIHLSLAGSVSICNRLRTPWTSTSFVCYYSILHTGTPSSFSCGCDRDNTFSHATRIGWLCRCFLR